jgi:Sec-independent protein secretion pathway component TatC
MPFTLAWAISFGFCFPWLPILGLFYEGIHAVSPSQARSRRRRLVGFLRFRPNQPLAAA